MSGSRSDNRSTYLEVGETYFVTWRNGNIIPGEIVSIRPLDVRRKQDKTSLLKLLPTEKEYYVHYIGYDRRLDEWVAFDRINSRRKIGDALIHNGKKRKNGIDDSQSEEAMLERLEQEHQEVTKVKNIHSIILGKYEIETWYFSPYPEEYCGEERLYICEYCLKYMKRQQTLITHMQECFPREPPGRQIYFGSSLAMFEVDGKEQVMYCQNLCLLSKLFLDHKTLYYDVQPFLFYVLCEVDSEGSHIVGYFSKEKVSRDGYNLACISTFPPYQRKGYGKFLISVSYELSKRENTTGSPEKPLSDLGKISYRSYWAYVILRMFQQHSDTKSITLNEIGNKTGICTDDILSTLQSLQMLRIWNNTHIIHVVSEEVEKQLSQAKSMRLCNPENLRWSPPEHHRGGPKKQAKS